MVTHWHEFQDTGYAPIDGDHREIAASQSRLLEFVNSARVVSAVMEFDGLLDRYRAHFAHEERLMVETGYEQAARHKEAHDLFLADSARMFVDLKKHGLSPQVRRWITGRLLEWFRFHIAANDVGLGRFLLARERKAEWDRVCGDPGS